MTLYNLKEEAKTIYELLNAEEIDEQTAKDTLDAMGVTDKLEAYGQVIRQMQADEDALEAEKKRIEKRLKQTRNGIERLKANLLDYLDATNTTKQTAGMFTFTRQRSSIPALKINESEIPIEFWRNVLMIDKEAVKEALKQGEQIPGAELEYSWGVRIK